MIKDVEEQTRLQNLSTLHRSMGLPYKQLFDVLNISMADQPRYLMMLKEIEQREDE